MPGYARNGWKCNRCGPSQSLIMLHAFLSVSSIEPDDSGSEMNRTEESAGGLVIAGGNAVILLELVEELLNQVACPVQIPVVFTGLFVAALGRNYDALPAFCKRSMTRYRVL